EKDIRTFHTLYDHKKVMNFRLNALIGDIASNNKHNQWKELVEKTEILELIFLKYSISKNVNMIKEMKNKLKQIENLEVDILTDFLERFR
ncbi:MAG: hypothetical protein K6G30_08550, partial [Acetatifactor sp.]|nr:hypothetical protein [Acetatifactor sp.]